MSIWGRQYVDRVLCLCVNAACLSIAIWMIVLLTLDASARVMVLLCRLVVRLSVELQRSAITSTPGKVMSMISTTMACNETCGQHFAVFWLSLQGQQLVRTNTSCYKLSRLLLPVQTINRELTRMTHRGFCEICS